MTRANDPDYELLAAFRKHLREFMAFSDRHSGALGLTQQQYQALLALRTHDGEPLSIRGLASLLLIKHHSAVGMVDRLEREGLVRREPSARDRRVVAVRLTPRDEKAFERLARVHRAELRRVAPEFVRIMSALAKPDPE
ncbi:MAG: MarR family winged helix-turn-helix transcriptional regulator [Usitatibacter sp.]